MINEFPRGEINIVAGAGRVRDEVLEITVELVTPLQT